MITITDVAQRARVSKGTVSRVLNDKMVMPISPATIARVKQAAADLGYRPSALGRALKTRRTHTLGLYYADVTDPHFARMLQAVEVQARELGYHIVVSTDLESLAAPGYVDGLLIVQAPRDERFTPPPGDRPAVFVWPIREPQPNSVAWSDFEGSRLAAEHLLRLGHRRFALIVGDYLMETPLHAKVAGFVSALRESGATWQVYRGAERTDHIENGYLLTRAWLSERNEVTALFARNDQLALGAMEAMREAGIAIPDEVSVVGYGDTVLSRCSAPRLTSVRTPIAEAGVLALEKLVKRIQGEEVDLSGTVLPVSLTERSSCAPAAGM